MDNTHHTITASRNVISTLRLRRWSCRLRKSLQVRIGIATGLVVVGAGSAQEQAIVGDTPNLAARLQAFAEPNTIIVAESTRRQIGALFEVVDLGRNH